MADISESKKNTGKDKAFQVLNFDNVEFEHPHPDIHVAKILIAKRVLIIRL